MAGGSAKKRSGDPAGRTLIANRKARFEFMILERFEAGIVLMGSEVKSLRTGRASLQESYVRIQEGEAWWIKGTIEEFPGSRHFGHDPKRRRKLLLRKHEIRKLHARVKEKGLTLVPLRIYLSERNLIKMEIGLAKGKKVRDKREEARRKIDRREMRDY